MVPGRCRVKHHLAQLLALACAGPEPADFDPAAPTLGTHGDARPVGPGDTPCDLCGEHAADGVQDDYRGGDWWLLCNLCAAPGRPLLPLTDDGGVVVLDPWAHLSAPPRKLNLPHDPLAVACPRAGCGSLPGSTCRTRGGWSRAPHRERHSAAKDER